MFNDISVYLVRHFETLANRKRKILGRSDEGVIESDEILNSFGCLKSLPLKEFQVFSSPAKRCRETLGKIGGDVIEVDDRLSEFDFGSFDGESLSALNYIKENFYKNPSNIIPNGESISQLSIRVSAFLGGIQQDAVIVTHGGVINAMLMNCLGLDINRFPLFKIDNGSVSKVIIKEDGSFIEYINRLD